MLILILVLATLALLLFRKFFIGSNDGLPGPLSFPMIGTSWVFNLGIYKLSQLHEFYESLHENYGNIAVTEAFWNVKIYNLFHRTDIEKILKSNSKFPIRPPVEALVFYRNSRPDRYSSAGLVNEQGTKWHELRSNLTSDLMSPKISQNFKTEAVNLAEEWCNIVKLKKKTTDTNLIESIETLIVTLCVETTCALVLGRRLNFMNPEKISPKLLKLNRALENHFKGIRDIQFSPFPIWKIYATSSYKLLVDCENFIYETVKEIVENYAEIEYENSVYASIVNAKIDDREKMAAIIDFIAAGIHTLKNSLIFLLYLVAKNGEKQERIISDEHELYAYSKAAMMESFRLLPTATPLARITEAEFTLSSGHRIPAGSVVLCHNSIACKSEENFENPTQFLPERWLRMSDSEELRSHNSFLVAPFGCGKRICPGKRFIETVLPIFLQVIVKNFKLETDHELELKFEFLMAPKGPVSMYFHDRN